MAEREIVADVAQRGVAPCAEAGRPRGQLNVALAVVALLVCVFAIFWRTTLSMMAIWERSETFAHGFVVIPIFCYLLWQRRDALAGLEPTPCWGALLGIVAAGFVWLLGEIVSAASVSQFAMVAMVPLAVWAVLGTRIAMAIGIPLAFLFFAVPFGEFLVPTMIDRTADFTVAALRLSGVPVYREGNYFVIPSGAWSVVDACSGLRYLIASLMVGCLYAYLMYRSLLRRTLLILASLIVPIIANWVRAYLIVMIGHLSSNRLAVGVDHLIYGWLFFGVVIALLFWIGSRWREDHLPAPARPGPPAGSGNATGRAGYSMRRVWAPALAAIALMVIWQPLRAHFDTSESTRTVQLTPIPGQDGWMPASEEVSDWKPDLSGSRAELRQTFVKDGQRVAVLVAFFRDQTADTKAISSTNQMVSTTNRTWRRIDAVGTPLQLDGSAIVPRAAVLIGPRERLEARQWYWVDGHVTSKDYEAKLYQALSVLRGHGDSVAWIIVYASADKGDAQASLSVGQFAVAMRGALDKMLRDAAAQ